MKYNFDQKVDRKGTGAFKLEGYKAYIFHADDSMVLPFSDEEFIHLWVADMEFECAPEILDAIRERLDRKILGYTGNLDSKLYDALSAWCKERYDFEFDQEDLVLSDGVVPAIVRIISYLVKEDEKIVFNTPAYGQFAAACKLNNREYITSDLLKDSEGRYTMNFEEMEELFAREDTKLFILCNPHNPSHVKLMTKKGL